MATGCNHKEQGFTLLEMAIVLAIMAIVSTGIVTTFAATLQKIQLQQTMVKMDAIQTMLYNYRIAYNRLPCPGDLTLSMNTLQFGMEATVAGACQGGAVNATFAQSPAVGPRDAVEGLLPVRTLRLPDDYAIDGWGRRFVYAVTKDVTQYNAFTAISSFDMAPRMSILNAVGDAKSTTALEVLMSLGPNGHGAYPRSGGSTRISASSVNVDELNNCDCDNAAATTGLDGVFVQKNAVQNAANALDSFDDLVLFTARGDYLLPSNLIAQPYTTNAGGSGGGLGGGGSGGNRTCRNGSVPACSVRSGLTTCSCNN